VRGVNNPHLKVGKNTTETFEMLKEAFIGLLKHVFEWFSEFRSGVILLKSERSGSPLTSKREENADQAIELVL
jgi:hypothetical protein